MTISIHILTQTQDHVASRVYRIPTPLTQTPKKNPGKSTSDHKRNQVPALRKWEQFENAIHIYTMFKQSCFH